MRKTKTGEVVGTSMEKTIVVRVEERYVHPRYHKYVRKHSKFYAHDADGKAGLGDTVKIEECRPLSRMKRWRLTSVVEKAEV